MSIATMPAAKLAIAACDRRKLFRLVLFFLTGILAAFAFKMPARADEGRTLIIPPNDGYGFEECLTAGSACGLVVADAWCKAHGYAASKAFEPAGPADVAPGSVHVTCGDRVN